MWLHKCRIFSNKFRLRLAAAIVSIGGVLCVLALTNLAKGTSWMPVQYEAEVHISKAPPFPDPGCRLPAGAAWAIAKPGSGDPFNIAVNSPYGASDGSNDDMSVMMRTRGQYEFSGPQQFPGLSSSISRDDTRPNVGTFLDVGANLGDWAFFMASAGWRVVAVEGGTHNVALMNATLCANPAFSERVHIVQALVGSKEQEGRLCSICGKSNGEVVCGPPDAIEKRVCAAGLTEFHVIFKSIETILKDLAIADVTGFKMDIEGFECEALAGYKAFAAQHSLTWAHIETTTTKTRACVRKFANTRWTRFGGSFTFTEDSEGNNAVLTRQVPWMIR
mmetsp:Transcript_19361/g.60887  ORF Transcript_19361/g.60887 Transcript_19361/m.60887 type:complete len:333 (-) Transcript_19361:110-1108(-)